MLRSVNVLSWLYFLCANIVIGNAVLSEVQNRNWVPNDIEGYVDRLIESLDTKMREHGINNLPVEDAVMKLNRTVYGEYLLGTAIYSSGVVISAAPWSRFTRFLQNGIRNETAFIIMEIDMPNITVFYNLFVNLSVGNLTGTAKHVFPTNRVSTHILFNLTNSEPQMKSMSPSSISGPLTDYYPDTNLHRAVARVARLHASTVLWQDIAKWSSELFFSMMNTIVAEIPIPFKIME